MANAAILTVRILADASNAQRGLDQTAGRMDKFASAAKKAMIPAAAAGAALVVMGKKAVDAASELEQAQGAVETVYGKSASAVEKFANTSVDRLGVARSEYLNSAALMGGALQNVGFDAQASAKITDSVFTRSADLAAAYGGTTTQAMDAINAAISRGEFDPLERLNVSLSATAVNAELAARGQDQLKGSAGRNAKAQATLDLIMEQSSKVHGQFAKEADTVAVRQQKARAEFKNTSAELGTALLPAVSEVAEKMADVARWAGENKEIVGALVGIVGGLAAAVYAVNAALAIYNAYTTVATALSKAWNNNVMILRARLIALAIQEKIVAAATKAWNIIQLILNASFWANPITWIVAGIIALVAAIIIAYKKSDTFRAIVQKAFAAIKVAAGAVVDFFTKKVPAAFDRLKTAASTAIGFVVDFVKKNWPLILAIITGPLGLIILVIVKNWDRIKGVFAAAFKFINDKALAMKNWIVARFTDTVNWIKGVPGRIKTAAGDLFKSIRDRAEALRVSIKGKIDRVVEFFKSLPGRIKSAAGNAFGVLVDKAEALRASIRGKVDAVVDFFREIPSRIKTAIDNGTSKILAAGKSLMTNLLSGLKSAGSIMTDIAGNVWTALKGMLNGAINKINQSIPNNLGPVDLPDNPFPHFANGGIVTSPTLAVIGDNPGHREAVIPLDKYDLGGSGDVTVEVHLDGQMIGRFVERKVDRAMGRQARRIVAGVSA